MVDFSYKKNLEVTMKGYVIPVALLSALACRVAPVESPFEVESVASERSPLDATPSPDGQDIFFVEADGVFQAGETITTIHQGAPLIAARGLAFAPNGDTLYVADPGADALFAVTFAGDPIDLLEDTQGLSPSAVDVQQGVNGDVLFFTGIDPLSGDQAVFQKDGDAAPALLLSDDTLINLDGITVSGDGKIFIADQGRGEIFSLQNGVLSSVISGINTGSPAGIELSFDEKTLLISAEDATDNHSEVVLVNLQDQSSSLFDDVIKVNSASGGLHRAQNANVFAWCGVSAGTSGTVFRITPN
jgi:DNA-binding beta-propeller fold protein YncE